MNLTTASDQGWSIGLIKTVYFMGIVSLHLELSNSDSPIHTNLMPHHCIYCGREIKRDIKGRLATREQLQHAEQYHHPQLVTNTYICDKHRRYPPTKGSSDSSQPKRKLGNTNSTESYSSSSLDSSSKRQRTAQILTSLSQQQQQPNTTFLHKTIIC
jgi:hypothetical protein